MILEIKDERDKDINQGQGTVKGLSDFVRRKGHFDPLTTKKSKVLSFFDTLT